jgi:hypothetical protein
VRQGLENSGEVVMSAVSFPSGISHALSVSIPPPPKPSGPIPIPFPNVAAHFETNPAFPLIQHLFGSHDGGGDLLGVAPYTDLSQG